MLTGLRRVAPSLVLVALVLAASSALADDPSQPKTEKPSAEKPLAEKPTTEKSLTEKPTTEKPLTENPTTAIRDPQSAIRGPIDLSSPNPPPSSYDRARGVDTTLPEPPESLVGQLFRTVLALGAVCGLIYLIFRWGPAKVLLQAQSGGRSGKFVRVVERVAVDQRSALLVVDIGTERLLVGSGEGGMRLLARMNPDGAAFEVPLSQTPRSFRSLIDIVRPKPSNEDDNAPK